MANVSNMLEEWAVREMNYTGPWTEDMAVLCTGPMAGVWEWVVDHCRSKEKVKMIQGNLALGRRRVGGDLSMSVSRVGNSSGDGGEREELLAERGRLMGDLHSVLAKIERVKGAVEQHNKDRSELSRCKEESVKEVKERQQRTVLLGLYVKQVTNTISKLEGLAIKLEKLMGRVDEKEAKGDRMFSSGSGVETESGKNMRDAVKMGVEHMKTALAGCSSKERRGEVRERIVKLVEEMPAAVVTNCLVEQTTDLTHHVKKKFESVDFVKDAKDLQEDENDNEFLTSVRREVGQFYKRHVTSQVASTNLLASITTWEEKADMAREKVGSLGEVDMEEEEKTKLRGMVASYRSSLDSLRSNIAGMELTGNTQPETVKNQQNQIEELGQTISALVVSEGVSSLKSSQAATLDTMTTVLPLLASQITYLSQSMTDQPSNHLTTMGTCPTSNLASTMVGGSACSVLTPVSQLLINRRNSTFPQLSGRVSQREDSVDRIVKLIMEVERRERELAHSLAGKVPSGDKEELDRLEKTLASSIREQGRNLGPMIEESEVMRIEAARISAAIEVLHKEWNSQPGAEVAVGGSLVWGEVEGRKLQQWVDLVRVSLAKLYSNNNT